MNDEPTYQCVVWVDARSDDGWTLRADLDMRLATITTLGRIIIETSEVLCVASSRDERTGQLSGIMYIPKTAIVKRTKLLFDKPREEKKKK